MPSAHPSQFDPVACISARCRSLVGVDVPAGLRHCADAGRYRNQDPAWLSWANRDLDDILFLACSRGAGRALGYVLFYKFSEYLYDPVRISFLWERRHVFHGGFLGVLVAMLWFAALPGTKVVGRDDFIAPLIPLGLGAGRIGNFINAELWGRPLTFPGRWFSRHVTILPRHPSQLYEFILEGRCCSRCCGGSPGAGGRSARLRRVPDRYGTLRFPGRVHPRAGRFLGLLCAGIVDGQWLSLPMVIGVSRCLRVQPAQAARTS